MSSPAASRPRFSPWLLVPVIGLSATIAANATLLLSMRLGGANIASVIDHAFDRSAGFDEEQQARHRFAAGFRLVHRIDTEGLVVELQPLAPATALPEEMRFACYRAGDRSLDHELRWPQPEQALHITPPARGAWILTLTGNTEAGPVRAGLNVYLP